MSDAELPPEDFLQPVELPITPELDLHTFRPKEIGELVPDYLEACREKGIHEVRIIHGKGVGHIRRSVHAILERLEYVDSFRTAPEGMGSWGATLAWLKPKKEDGDR